MYYTNSLIDFVMFPSQLIQYSHFLTFLIPGASPVRLIMLGAGRHELEISPRDCAGDSKTLSVQFSA